ncbi:rhodanese-like domain-containing protein [Lichenicoccus roseus]|uniref:Rhodanese-like domain-containing protein n=1 Tax=Lichenicoccus roseus TaxID=2683649 RepID=A0A5R9J983_9PROT|nr:rhodanese-like domain-containing protein [Lichenicoccus roseus]TLU73107.1 rhodanese-like domain-containing protein [Lichenicoccus roseus]
MVEDVAPQQAWEALAADPAAQLVDVRTDAEWTYVGLPDLAPLQRQVLLIMWQAFPTGAPNPHFLQQLTQAGLQPEQDIYFICRSGARSLAAAEAARSIGFERVYNVADGFEGPPDARGHRGAVAGWKASGLPWRQR